MALRNSDPLPCAIAWGAVILSSALPTIIWRESAWASLIHVVQDVGIFSFLAMSAAK